MLHVSGPVVQQCLSGGLWDAGASITVGGKHIANWLIGQVRNETLDKQRMIDYADEIGADREDFMKALAEVRVMPVEQFKKVSEALFAFANEISEKAYNNLQLKKQIADREKATTLLHESRKQYRNLVEGTPDLITRIDADGYFLFVNHASLKVYGLKPEACIGRSIFDFIHPEDRSATEAAFQSWLKSGPDVFTHENRLVSITGQIHYMEWTICSECDEAGNFCGFSSTARDITERKLTENALQQSKRELATLMNNLPGMVYFCSNDQDWTMKFISEGSFNLTGYFPDEFIDNKIISYNQIIHPDDRKAVWATIQEAIKNESAFAIEYRIIKKDGSVKHVSERGQGLFSSDHILLHLEGFVTDISERKQAEEALERSKLLLISSLESQKNTILLAIDRNYRYLYFNKAHSDIMKSAYNKDIKLGMNILECITSDEDRKADIENYDRALNGESHSIIRMYGDIEHAYYESFFTPIINDNKEIIGVTALARNITERKRAEDALLESGRKYSSLFNSMLEGFALHEIVCDTSGKPIDYCFLDMNPAFEKLTGLKKTDAIGKSILTIFPETEYFWIESYGKVALTGEPITFENYSIALKRHYQVVAFSPRKNQFAVIFSDITERKMAEEALRKSETRFRTIINVSPVPMALNDDQQRITFLNQAFIQMFGYTQDDIPTLAHWWPEAYPDPEYRQQVADAWQAELKQTEQAGAVFSPMEVTMKCKNGMNKTVLVSATLLSDSLEGNHLAVFYDITERKLAEEALQSRTALLEAQANASNNGILVIDENNKRLLSNRRIVELFNIPPHILADEDDSVLLKHVVGLTRYPEQFMEKIMYLNTHINETSRDEIEFKNGMVLDRYSAPVLGKDGKYYGRIWTFNDITERKRTDAYKEMGLKILQILNEPESMQDSLQHVLAELKAWTGFDAVGIRLKEEDDFPYFAQQGFSNDFLLKENTLIERTATGGVCRDKNGNICLECTCGLVISGKTDPANKLFTRGGSFWTNDSFPILKLPENQDPRRHPRNECIHHGYSSVALVPLRNKDMIVGLIQFNDRRKGCFTLDVIEILEGIASHIGAALMRKQVESELIKAKEKAEESDRLKSAFLANMSHEIRTPMNGILGFTELLKEPHLTGEEQQQYISIIEKSGDRMLNTINDIISISKIESGQMDVSISETNINEQIEYIYSFFKPEVEQKGIHLSLKNTLPAQQAIIKTDTEKVYAILTNLVKNAVKFTSTGSIEIGYEKKAKYLEFFVKDTGIGIPVDRRYAIFDRFVQAQVGNRRAFQGAGLGLSISKAYVEMLGGRIWVESEEGKGSIFYFTIPCNTELEAKSITKAAVPAEENNTQIKDLKILIAEDDEKSEMLVSITVKKFGREILKARTGTEAVEACRNNPDIDLVLMDIEMPVMDGYEATRQIRQFNQAVIIIAQTAFALAGDREKATAAGCDDYIAKPFNKNSLISLLKKYF